MVLSFKQQFISPITEGTKIHTIREDKHNRWKPGQIIHGATGVRTKNYNQFFEDVCQSVQTIEIKWKDDYLNNVKVIIDGRELNLDEKVKIAKNDGFKNLFDFFLWFDENFKGKIIHWTNFKY